MSSAWPDIRKLPQVGRHEVTARAADIAAFRDACALPLDDAAAGVGEVPFTYPFRWIGLPEVRAALRRIESVDGGMPVHMGQTITPLASVVAGETYDLDVRWRDHRDRADRRVTLEIFATAHDRTGREIVRMSSSILIIPPDEAIR